MSRSRKLEENKSTYSYIFVKTLEAAVCPIAYSPALLDFPKTSFDKVPVTGSAGA